METEVVEEVMRAERNEKGKAVTSVSCEITEIMESAIQTEQSEA